MGKSYTKEKTFTENQDNSSLWHSTSYQKNISSSFQSGMVLSWILTDIVEAFLWTFSMESEFTIKCNSKLHLKHLTTTFKEMYEYIYIPNI